MHQSRLSIKVGYMKHVIPIKQENMTILFNHSFRLCKVKDYYNCPYISQLLSFGIVVIWNDYVVTLAKLQSARAASHYLILIYHCQAFQSHVLTLSILSVVHYFCIFCFESYLGLLLQLDSREISEFKHSIYSTHTSLL